MNQQTDLVLIIEIERKRGHWFVSWVDRARRAQYALLLRRMGEAYNIHTCPTIDAPGIWAAPTFFTLNLLQRAGNDLLIRHIEDLRVAVRRVRSAHPFTIHGWVVLPDHLHCVISLPEGDADFALRLRLIKIGFSKAIAATEWRSAVRKRRGERGIWQRRYWEHLIRDEADFAAHMDYVHINPLKHGLVQRASIRWIGRGARAQMGWFIRIEAFGAIRFAIAPYVDCDARLVYGEENLKPVGFCCAQPNLRAVPRARISR